jgi:hypothetical protein
MSWDLAVHSPAGTLGSVADVRRKVDASIAVIAWSDDAHGVLQQGGYILEFSLIAENEAAADENDSEDDRDAENDEEDVPLDPAAPVSTLMIAVRGTGEPLPVIVQLCKRNGWLLTDVDADEAIDLDHPSDRGWRDFQEFRDRVAGSLGDESKPGLLSRLFGRRK